MKNEERLFPIIEKFYNKIKNKDFVIDKTGVNCVELICENIYLNPMQDELNFYNIRKTPKKYVDDELKWYLSQSLSIIGYVDNIKIWNEICTKDDKKEVNSNYGWCVFSKDNYEQYKNCLNELKLNKESRRAAMIYNRPSIWEEFKRNGMSDYICTFVTQQFIRENKLIYVVNMRSNDFIKGFFSDFSWHCYVYNKLFKDLKEIYNYLEVGHIIWIANSLHLYQNDFEKIVKIYEEEIKHGK
jgi:thymidylate synthase